VLPAGYTERGPAGQQGHKESFISPAPARPAAPERRGFHRRGAPGRPRAPMHMNMRREASRGAGFVDAPPMGRPDRLVTDARRRPNAAAPGNSTRSRRCRLPRRRGCDGGSIRQGEGAGISFGAGVSVGVLPSGGGGPPVGGVGGGDWLSAEWAPPTVGSSDTSPLNGVRTRLRAPCLGLPFHGFMRKRGPTQRHQAFASSTVLSTYTRS
jgi:hypothetical protein